MASQKKSTVVKMEEKAEPYFFKNTRRFTVSNNAFKRTLDTNGLLYQNSKKVLKFNQNDTNIMNKKLKQDFKDFKKKNNLNIQSHVAIKNELLKFAKEKPEPRPHK